jgi:GT2 family glycosyltransferase/glycosyltransferase involved in cell wall biosynthesis
MERGLSGLRETAKSALYAIAGRLPQRLLPVGIKLRMLIRSGVLDYKWYRHTTQQIPMDDMELALGVFYDDRERVGNPLFSADFYRVEYKVPGSPGEALLHYVLVGERLGYKPCAWFDPVFFRAQNPDAPRDGNALAHFIRGWPRYRKAHPYFDPDWYLARYPDVAEAGHNPLVHFANHGPEEGREPNAFFNSTWYLAQNPDIASSGMSASVHFGRYGATELRNPGPNFDMRRYAARFVHYAETGLDPLAHYLTYGREEGLDIGRLCLTVDDFALPPARQRTPAHWAVDVVVPVYRNVEETRRCLESLLASDLPADARLLVYNDQSPEPAVTEYLRGLATQGRILLRENEHNLGFVGTVNRAMRESLAAPGRDAVLLLNSDTEVANDWVQRLCAHAAADATVASVTALSNNATICSFPHIGANDFPEGISVAEMDALAARANPGVSVDIPTAVGFCMLIPLACLREVGLFDEEAFGKGYGEENDFCLRAAARGYRHLLATDVFVRHVGEVSFGSTSSPGKENAGRIILERYPDYNALVARHIGEDPAFTARARLTFAMWKRDRKPVVALVTHDVGGGTEQQVGVVCEALAGDHHVIVIKPVAGHVDRIFVENRAPYDAFQMVLDLGDGQGFATFLQLVGVQQVQVHHLLGHGPIIRQGLARAGIPHEFHIHDYYTLCPQVTLTNADYEYCGEPDAHGCNACIARRPSNGASDIVNWRLGHDWAVRGASRVVAPSRDAAARMRRYHDVDVDVVYHEPPLAPVQPRLGTGHGTTADPLRVVILGVLAPHKGKYKVLQALEAIAREQLPVHVHLIGYLGLIDGEMSEAMAAHFSSTGWYKEAELEELIHAARPDLFLFASTAPETYSFTLTRAMRTGLPIVAPAHGAYPERLADYPLHWLYDPAIGGDALAARIHQYAASLDAAAGGRHATA